MRKWSKVREGRAAAIRGEWLAQRARRLVLEASLRPRKPPPNQSSLFNGGHGEE